MKHKHYLAAGAVVLFALFLRVFTLTANPPGLYWEEVALGYDAYSIAQTARDHHGQFLPIVAFESFGDWKPSLYFYAVVPFVKVLGLNAWAVRLPSALTGVLSVAGVGLLTKLLLFPEINKAKRNHSWWPVVAMALTAISPWAIQFSRGGWEVNLASGLILWGTIAGLKATQSRKESKQRAWWLLSAVLLVLSMYSYHAARIIAPLLGVTLVALASWKQKKIELPITSLLPAGVMAVLLAFPLVLALGSNSVTQRFNETSLFSDLSMIEESNHLKDTAGNTLLARIVYHRYLLFGREVVVNYLDHFNPTFLFISGDINPRHSTQWVGELYHIEALFILLGLVGWWKLVQKDRRWLLLPTWLLVGILPAALTRTTPHALRILPTFPIWILLVTLGIRELFGLVKKYDRISTLLAVLLISAYAAEFTYYWRFYTTIYPQEYATHWQVGYPEMVDEVQALQTEHPDYPIYISREAGRPAMYYWFYTQTDPRSVQAENDTAQKDQGEFLTFQNVSFVGSKDGIESPAITALMEDETHWTVQLIE